MMCELLLDAHKTRNNDTYSALTVIFHRQQHTTIMILPLMGAIILSLLGLSLLPATAAGSTPAVSTEVVTCPPEDITLTMAGTTAGNGLIDAWQRAYSSEHCPGFNVTFETNSWDSGAARVCASSLLYDPVDMASMAGTFFYPQVTSTDGWSFQCKRSKLVRETLLLRVAHKGIAIGIKKQGVAASCIKLLGGGLSKDQLRWMYSGFSTKQLIASGWDPKSVPFLDDDDSTHLWSEIHENCTAEEIVIVGDNGKRCSADEYFLEHVLSSRGETIRDHQDAATIEIIGTILKANEAAIAFFHLYDMVSSDFQVTDLMAVGVKNHDGEIILPTAKAFETGSYPFMQEVYLGLVNDPLALEYTRPFLEFCLSNEGTQILKGLFYWPIREEEKLVMYTRIGSDRGLELEKIKEQCGPLDGNLAVGGSDTVLPVVSAWSEIYKLGCPMDIEIEGGGSSLGAFSVCASSESGDAVDVGMMSREFDFEDEAVPRAKNKFVYDCIMEEGEESRSVIHLDVALDGISVVFPIGGIGERCVRLLGGLTMDQLRWMYSSYSDTQLEGTGWNPDCLSNSDFDSSTHKWSELDYRCAEEEIQLSGDYWDDGSFISFSKQILKNYDKDERIADNRKKPYMEVYGIDALMYLSEHEDAVSYVGYHYLFEHQDLYWAAPVAIDADSLPVAPSLERIGDGTYPLTRSIFVNIYNDEAALRYAVPVIKFGYSNPSLILSSGYVPIVGDHLEEMLERLDGAPYLLASDLEEESSGNKVGIILGSIFAALVVIGLIIGGLYFYRKWD